MRSARIKGGNYMEAIGWGKEMAAYCEKTFGTGKIHVMLDLFGEMGTIRWESDYADLAALEKVNAKVMVDAEYWKRIHQANAAGLFIEGSVVDIVSREV
jgi:hypothetical protein